ncbi:MAG: tetratricopeptide repeat protein [Micropepsaceae bacterium]
MTKDLHDLELTTACAGTVAAYNVFAGDWIGYGPRVRSIFAAADADADCALVNAHAAAVHMALEAAPGFKTARGYLRRARKAAAGATAREQAFVAAINDWWRGNVPGALKRLRSIVVQNPADIVAAKWAQYLAFNLGDAAAMLAVAKGVLPAHEGTAGAWSMLAFAHEQNNAIGVAEEAAYRALSIDAKDPWAHHAIAHVMETRGKADDGIAFLTKHAAGWADRSIFVREHNYWHLALFHIDREEPKLALEIFDKHLWGIWREFAQEQIGAISALLRLELRGADVGQRWEPVVKKVIERWHEHILPFNDLHFVYALARGGRAREAREFLASMRRHGANDVSGVWESVAIPCAEGLVAYAERRFAAAAEAIGPVLARLHLIGGSHTQRDVFVQTWIDASLRAGRHSAVAHVIDLRARTKPKEAARLLQLVAKAA